MIANFGNILPFYKSTAWQAFRMQGQDILAAGILAPNDKLLPFQLSGKTGTATGVSWALVNCADETVTVAMSAGELQIRNVSGGGWFVTWFGLAALSTIVDAGFWYVRVTVAGVNYFSEALKLVGDSEEAMAGMNVTACSGNLQFTIVANDTYTGTLTSETTEYYNSGSWVPLGPLPQTVAIQEPSSPIAVRRQITLNTGRVLSCDGTITWSNPLNPCADLAMTVTAAVAVSDPNELYRVRFTRSEDRPPIMHQTGFGQALYLPKKPVFDRPVTIQDPERSELADGTTVLKNGVLKHVIVFEFSGLFDNQTSGIVFAAMNAELVVVEGIVSGTSFTLTDVQFTSEKTGIQLNKGILSGVSNVATFECVDNYVLL
jgi:hypothetical protein